MLEWLLKNRFLFCALNLYLSMHALVILLQVPLEGEFLKFTNCICIFTILNHWLFLSLYGRSKVCHLAFFCSWNSKRILFFCFLLCLLDVASCFLLSFFDPTPTCFCYFSVISSGICPTFHFLWHFHLCFISLWSSFLSNFYNPRQFFLMANIADCAVAAAAAALWEEFGLNQSKPAFWPNHHLTLWQFSY